MTVVWVGKLDSRGLVLFSKIESLIIADLGGLEFYILGPYAVFKKTRHFFIKRVRFKLARYYVCKPSSILIEHCFFYLAPILSKFSFL